ncbi:MAG: hypothetical protein MHM6MM_000135 [Cercozoa sp. M6MM]
MLSKLNPHLVQRVFRPAVERSTFLSEKQRAVLLHPAGPLTIHFWCSIFKWGLVMAGISDMSRPAEHISVPMSLALSTTGFIWARYCWQIIPVNVSLGVCNIFVGLTGAYQLGISPCVVLPLSTRNLQCFNVSSGRAVHWRVTGTDPLAGVGLFAAE